PYFFTMSNNLNYYYSIQKSNGILVSNGRSGVLRKNNSEIYFALGDIKVNEQKVAFVECPVELEINNVNLLNQYLETEAFELNDNSSFEYTVQYGVVDTSTINGMFQQGEQIRFKVELVDNNTGELLGVYDDVVYDQNNHTDFENILYQVNTQGIGQRTVKLRLRIEENLNPEATMVDRLDTESVLGKNKRKEIKFQGEILPEEYALEQNYPNPFNPTTKIRYSIPSNVKGQKSNVILKVYDILGNEVATLVNEPKEPGYYEVEFSIGSFRNASELASGVYIYRLTAGNFVASRKMMLIK
ncbi:MAG: T9SS type A sorting domain-containing protein, partial [Ignavibacterium sp.]|uniref:T9SS type A sorting domain-containing protein n=1 Tax=Ignavibacterium sp. TaxID=2651167 RepID=UPI00404ABF71